MIKRKFKRVGEDQAIELSRKIDWIIPTQGMCKDCEQSQCLGEECYCNNVDEYFDKDFYCADFEKRGSENGI